MAHHRLFVALRPPATVRTALAATMGGIAHARWQDDEQLHCTVRFIGEVDSHRAADVAAALAAIAGQPVDATLAGLGSFADRGRINSLWVGLAPIDALQALHAKVDRLLVAGAGIAPDGRAYRPHITLARFARGAAPAGDLAMRMPAPPPLAMRFDELLLYESRLTRDGAVYEPIERYPLGVQYKTFSRPDTDFGG